MKKIEQVEKCLEELKNNYDEKIINFAQNFFDTNIKNLCDTYKLKLLTGNGDFYFEHLDNSISYYIDEIPSCMKLSKENKEIFSMTLENYYMPCNNLGSLCKPYNPIDDI
jgi:hypothetical protein